MTYKKVLMTMSYINRKQKWLKDKKEVIYENSKIYFESKGQTNMVISDKKGENVKLCQLKINLYDESSIIRISFKSDIISYNKNKNNNMRNDLKNNYLLIFIIN